MANYNHMLVCPKCGQRDLNLLNYVSLMVIKHSLGLFTMECANCSTKINSIQPIPAELQPEIQMAALEINARMGN